MEYPKDERGERGDEAGEHLDEGTVHTWLDGQLPADAAAQAEAHIAACAKCSALVAEARGYVAASSRILTALDAVPARVLPHQRRRLRPWQIRAAAAAVILALGTTVVLHDAGGPSFMSREVDALADKRAALPSAVLPRVAAPTPAPIPAPTRPPTSSPSAPARRKSVAVPYTARVGSQTRADERSASRAGTFGGVLRDSIAAADQSAARAHARTSGAAEAPLNAMAKAPANMSVPARTGAVAGAAGGLRRSAAPTLAAKEPTAEARTEPKAGAPSGVPAATPPVVADSPAAGAQAMSAANSPDTTASLQRQITTARAPCVGTVARVATSLSDTLTVDSMMVRLDPSKTRDSGYPGFALAAVPDSNRALRGDWVPTGSDSAEVEVDSKGEPVRTRVRCGS